MSQINWEMYAYHLLVISTRFFSESNFRKYQEIKQLYLDSNAVNDVERRIKEVIQNIEKMDQEFIQEASKVEEILKKVLETKYSNPIQCSQQNECGCDQSPSDLSAPPEEELKRWWK